MPRKRPRVLDLQQATGYFRLLAEPTRLRLLLLLEREELSVAELAAITQLAQPRISTHLARLKEANLVSDRREGVSVFYRIAANHEDSTLAAMWEMIRASRADPLLQQDLERLPRILQRRGAETWADSVAGDMERHYSPGRTWEATARALVQLIEPGEVLDVASGDGVMAEILAERARRVLCVDISEKVVAAGRRRLATVANVRFETGDMHQLPVEDQSFDTVLLMHALTYTRTPQKALAEAARALRPGGRLVAVTLARHRHRKAVEPYNHANLGFTPEELRRIAGDSGLDVEFCQVSAVERRSPHFTIVTLLATRR